MKFHDRTHAGVQLAQVLQKHRTASAVVLTVPHGGVVCAAPVAVALGAPLDLVFVNEIFHPRVDDFVLGAVNEHGAHVLRPEAMVVDQRWLAEEIARQKYYLRRQRHLFLTNTSSISLQNKTVFLISDGLATHLAMQLAIESIRPHHPAKIIMATPVAPPQIVKKLRQYADVVEALEQPQYFFSSVENYYTFYNPVTEAEIKNALHR